jgi:hypothetical protein
MRAIGRRLLRIAAVLGGLGLTLMGCHLAILYHARLEPPQVSGRQSTVREEQPGLRWYGKSYAYEANDITEVRLQGSPEEIGWAMGTLLRQEIIQTETRLYEKFNRYVPKSWARALLLDWARIRYSHLDRNLDSTIRQELAAHGRALEPDPFTSFMPTYQRLVYLSSLYDISLSFEHAPLVGCTTFLVRGPSSRDGHSFMARNFDFEVDDIFDEKKVAYVMLERGAIPYVSIAWPGISGVVSAMNAFGVAIVAHGGRAGQFDFDGEPVLQTLRSVIGHAKTSREAVELLRDRRPMVSHIVVTTDAQGDGTVIERVPGQQNHIYRVGERAVITNHFIGPAADDPKNVRIRNETSTIYRQQCGEQLLAQLPRRADASQLVSLLRHRQGINGTPLPLGDRRAIGALIAAHGVIFDCTAHKVWVSAAPHLLGQFIELDLDALLAPGANPVMTSQQRHTLPQDDLLSSGEYLRWKASTPAERP